MVNPNPGGAAAAIFSLLPPIAPMAMPVRIAGRVYASALLRTGARVPLRRALQGGGGA